MRRLSLSLFMLLVFTLLTLACGSLRAASDILIVVTPTVQKESSGEMAGKSPTAFSDVVTPGPESAGLIDTEEALRRASSVDLSDYGGAQTSPVTLRGSSFQQTLIMLDGVPVNPVSGDMVDVSRYMLPDVDEIEIIKGSNSASFGKAAMGGAINLVTKDPAMTDEYDLSAAQGTYGYGLYHGHMSTRAGEIGILANLTHAFAENDFCYEQEDGNTTRRENNGMVNTTGLMKAVFDAQGWKTSLTGSYIDQENGSPGSEGSAGYITPDDKVYTRHQIYRIASSREVSDVETVDLRAWILTNRTETESVPFGDATSRLTSESCSASYERKLGPVTLNPRAEYLSERMSSDDYGTHWRGTGSGILAAGFDLRPVFLEATGRCDKSSEFGSHLSYHAGAAWKVLESLQLKANAGTGYVEPTMGQLYAPSTWYTFISNTDLQPEKSVGFDIGPVVTYKSLGASANYFFTRYRDIIKMDYPAPNTFTYVNLDEAKASGVEASAWVAPLESIMMSANYIQGRYTYESGAYEGNIMKLKPSQVLNLQADYYPEIAGRAATLTVAYQLKGRAYADEANTERTDARYLLSVGALYDVNPGTNVSFKIDNLFDDQSPEYVDKTPYGTFWYPVPGRTYRFAVKVAL